MSVDGLELDLLRRLVLEPRLLGDSDIKDSDFSPGQGREGFAEISAIYEE